VDSLLLVFTSTALSANVSTSGWYIKTAGDGTACKLAIVFQLYANEFVIDFVFIMSADDGVTVSAVMFSVLCSQVLISLFFVIHFVHCIK
jgi:hypothetical protein